MKKKIAIKKAKPTKQTVIRTIGVITTGGDAPGMNTAIRAVVRFAIFNNLRVVGIERGWKGMVDKSFIPMDLKSVGGIINRGGTILHTARMPEFAKPEVRKIAYANLKKAGIDALVVIGGEGSLKAASALNKDFGLPTVNIPASIDNDVPGTDYTIGFDTAVNTAMEAIDKIRDTATSHERIFVIEVMGRDCGSIALEVGLVCGAEAVLIPEIPFQTKDIVKIIDEGVERGKKSFIVVVAEGASKGDDVAAEIRKHTNLDVRVSVLGHMQRGGAPSGLSRELACRMGSHAVDCLLKGKKGILVGIVGGHLVEWPYEKVWKMTKNHKVDTYNLLQVLAK